MKRIALIAAVTGAVALVAGRDHAAYASRAAFAEPTHTVWDSVYTDAQTKTGDSLYKATCIKCHGAELKGGDDGSPLAGEEFMKSFDGRPLSALFDQIRNSMPPDNPKSIPRAQVANIVAYLLAQNHFPAGAAPLTDDMDRLSDIKFIPTKP
jgi:mono/diheme cytochrome c family protein